MKTKEMLQLGGVIVVALIIGNVASNLIETHVLSTKPKA